MSEEIIHSPLSVISYIRNKCGTEEAALPCANTVLTGTSLISGPSGRGMAIRTAAMQGLRTVRTNYLGLGACTKM